MCQGAGEAQHLLHLPAYPLLEQLDVHMDIPDGAPQRVLVASQAVADSLRLPTVRILDLAGHGVRGPQAGTQGARERLAADARRVSPLAAASPSLGEFPVLPGRPRPVLPGRRSSAGRAPRPGQPPHGSGAGAAAARSALLGGHSKEGDGISAGTGGTSGQKRRGHGLVRSCPGTSGPERAGRDGLERIGERQKEGLVPNPSRIIAWTMTMSKYVQIVSFAGNTEAKGEGNGHREKNVHAGTLRPTAKFLQFDGHYY